MSCVASAVALRSAALQTYVPSRIVQSLDPQRDPVLLGRSGFEVEERPAAYLALGRETRATAHEPNELLAKIDELESQRR